MSNNAETTTSKSEKFDTAKDANARCDELRRLGFDVMRHKAHRGYILTYHKRETEDA